MLSEVDLNDQSRPAHPTAVETTSGGGIVCAACGKVSDSSTRFCGGCGVRLWESCPACDTVNPIDLRFCGGCGKSLEQALDEARQSIQKIVDEADRKGEQGRFIDAIRLLDGIDFADHTGLEDLRKMAKVRSEECAAQREAFASSATEVLDEVRTLADAGKTLDAFKTAKRIPPALRGLELRTLYDELESKVEEVKRLRRHVQQGLAEKDYAGIYGAVQRLVEIDPDNEKMHKLAAKLELKRSKLERAAARKQLKLALTALKQCDYRSAEAALAKAPDSDLDEKTTKAMVGARERVWLAHQLARAPLVDEPLLSVADRLAKLQPHDEKVAQLRAKVRLRWKEGVQKHPGQPINWSKSSAEDDGLDIASVEGADALAERLAKKGYPTGQFMIAYGLALQAAGHASLDINLSPQRKNWASRLSLGRGRKKGDTVAWGIDIGSHSVKAVKLVVPEAGGGIAIDAVIMQPTRPDDATNAGAAGSSLPAGAASAAQRLIEEHDFTGARVALGMPGTQTLGRFFKLPWLSDSKFEEAIRYEARMRIPLDPEDVHFDHTETEVRSDRESPHDDDDNAAKVMRVALVGATRTHVDERTLLFADSGASAVVVSSDCIALANAYGADVGRERKGDGDAIAIAIVDIGAKATNFAILSPQGCWFRGSYFGSESFDQELVKQLKCSWQKAKDLRHRPSKATWMHEVDGALLPAFETCMELIERTLTQYRNEEGKSVGQILLCGGGAEQFGLMRYLRCGQ